MAPFRIVPALDELEDGHAGLRLGLELPPIEQLALQGGEEALAHRIVVGIANRPHRRPDAGFLAAQAEGDRGVLRSLVRVMDHVDRTPLRQRHVEGIEHELGFQIVAHRPADDPA